MRNWNSVPHLKRFLFTQKEKKFLQSKGGQGDD
jgi:hypothetical protein